MYLATVHLELEDKQYEFPQGVVRLHIWDTVSLSHYHIQVGHDDYVALTKNYFQGSSLAIVVFDATDSKSFHSVPKWIDMVRKHTAHDVSLYVAANKIDLATRYLAQTPVVDKSLKWRLAS